MAQAGYCLGVLVLCLVVSAAVIEFDSNNITLQGTQSSSLSYRRLSLTTVPITSGLFNFRLFLACADAVGEQPNDLIASGFVASTGFAPYGFSLYFNDSTLFTSPTSETYAKAFSKMNSAVVVIPTQLQEVNALNNPVGAPISLASLVYTTSEIMTDSSGNIHYYTFTGSTGGFTISFTIVQSSIVGRLTIGSILSPKNTNVIVELNNYKFSSSSNRLVLTYAVGYALSESSNTTLGDYGLSSGSGPSQVYFNTASSVLIGNTSYNVNVRIKPLSSVAFPSNTAMNWLTSVSSNVQTVVVQVSLPTNAESWLYQHAIGFEQPTTSAASRVNSMHIIATVIVSCLWLLILPSL